MKVRRYIPFFDEWMFCILPFIALSREDGNILVYLGWFKWILVIER